VRRIAAGASADPDADHSAGDHDHLAQFRELGRGFRWAWDEEVAAGAAHLPERQGARLAAACPVVADALEEEVLRRDVPRDVGPERASSDALDAKAVVAQGVASREQLPRQAQLDVPRLALRARSRRPERARRVLQREPQARDLVQARVPRLARVSRPLVLEHAGLEEPPPRARGPEALPPRADALRELRVQQREMQLEARADAQPLSPRLPWRRVRLRRRFRRPLHPAGAA